MRNHCHCRRRNLNSRRRRRGNQSSSFAAILLAVLGGNEILRFVGTDWEDAKIELLLSLVKGKDVAELIAAGMEKLASSPSGVGDGVVVPPCLSRSRRKWMRSMMGKYHYCRKISWVKIISVCFNCSANCNVWW